MVERSAEEREGCIGGSQLVVSSRSSIHDFQLPMFRPKLFGCIYTMGYSFPNIPQ